MADLSDEAKLFIVQAFARFSSPAEVVVMIREDFGIETTIQQVRTYNPEHPKFEAGSKWRPIFEAVRKVYLEDVSSIPIASQAFRLNALQKNYDRAIKHGNVVLANATLEQAAKEVGGVLTNARNVSVQQTAGGFRNLTSEERRIAVAEMIGNVLSKDASQTAPSTQTSQ
ncbi:MAG: DUF2280 domain-containing protein [Sphingobium sp.]|jgi:hypothetical protein|uniref:DUF2280 domain-containing protein n=1 Tax=Sphingobium TaxID=165695 RepID=UPI000C48C071|nr:MULTISPECIES: DUF2280 domain-containing protein [Sphingobium]MBU0659209.1 DUF2280 domain-containing protein [Alphaproteobacteria bacterium]MBA4755384.1 DUF2280 domain-containing protein [Sphingobium sp.]MBS89936.1 hypothetical protein [Sphingobium sp.]MBU0775742.1 DUF2280 domain-containing protein [Alphaproteobacteria bacterium]MBU1258149.1 DUF2280 domain-containing protein [Alphaproteobacteria bacterium]